MNKSERAALIQIISVADGFISDVADGGFVDDRIRERVCNEMEACLNWLRGYVDAKVAPWKQSATPGK